MHRRSLLRIGAGAIAASTVGHTVAAGEIAPYEPLSEVEIDDAAEVVLSDDGRTAYVAADSGFVTVDVSRPERPTVLADQRPLETPDGDEVQEVLDVAVDGEKLLVPTAAQGDGPRGFFLYDVSDPADPTQIGEFFDTPHRNHNSFLLDDLVYLTGRSQEADYLNIVDVSDEPFEQVGRWSPARNLGSGWGEVSGKVLHDVWVQDNIAYCAYWDAGTFLVGVSDPANPAFVSRIGDFAFEDLRARSRAGTNYTEPPGNAHYATVNEDASVLAVGRETWDAELDDGQGGPAGISLYDITDPTEPTHLSDINPPTPADDDARQAGTWTTAHNFQFQGDRLYTSWYQGGVKTFDVSDPENPTQLAWWRDPDYAFWTARTTESTDFFVATARDIPNSRYEGLVLFSDEQAEQTSPSSAIVEADPLFDSENEFYLDLPADFGVEGWTPTTRRPTTQRTTATPVETTEGTVPETGDDSTPDDSTPAFTGDADSSTPGFGILTAMAGFGLGAARFLRKREE